MLLIMTIGGIIAISILCRKRRRRPARSGYTRTVTTRTVTNACLSARNQTPKTPQRDTERERQRICHDYNRRIKAELEKRQARDDIVHLTQRKRDLLEAYSKIPDNDEERTIRRRITYDNAIRNTEKQIEKAYMILHRTY